MNIFLLRNHKHLYPDLRLYITQFNKTALVSQKNNHSTKIIHAYIVYYLDYWIRNPCDIFVLKNCLYGTTNTLKNSDKSKYVYIGQKIAFDKAGSLGFSDYYARNVIIFGVDNSSSF